jgi:hypothetical protein
MAVDRGARVEIRGASSLRPGQARERRSTWGAADVADSMRAGRLLRWEGQCPYTPVKRRLASWSAPHPLERDPETVRAPSLRSALRLAVRASLGPARVQEQAGRHPRCLGLVDRGLLDGSLADARTSQSSFWRSFTCRRGEVRGHASNSCWMSPGSIRAIRDRRACHGSQFSSASQDG